MRSASGFRGSRLEGFKVRRGLQGVTEPMCYEDPTAGRFLEYASMTIEHRRSSELSERTSPMRATQENNSGTMKNTRIAHS